MTPFTSLIKLAIGTSALVAMTTLDVSPAFAQSRHRSGSARSASAQAVPRGRPGPVVSRSGRGPHVVRGLRDGRYYRPYYRSRYYASPLFLGLGFGYPYGPYPFYAGYSRFGYYPSYGYGYGWGPWGPWGPYGGYYPIRPEYAPDQGGIRLQVTPKNATVYVDNYYVGIIDDFDGGSQRLKLEAGPHKLEMRAPGYQTLAIEVNILRNETIRYRSPMQATP